MQTLTYLAVFEPCENGAYSVYFPDLPGCISYGDNLVAAQHMAAEAAELHVYGMRTDGDPVPEPSAALSKEDTEGNIVVPVTIHPDVYQLKRDNERVKTNTTLPLWLKRIAEAQGVNYSRLLESALLDYLQIPAAKA